VQDEFLAFVNDPSPENFLRLRREVVGAPTYNPYTDEARDIERMLEAGDAERAKEMMVPAMANYLLNPGAHLLLGDIYEKLGDGEAARRERAVAAACLKAILASGDGTAGRPYLVTRVSDEYDVLAYLKRPTEGQSLRSCGGRMCDVIRCRDGGEVWFDVTEAFEKLGGQFRA
jgi:hypothetical protein